MPLKSFHCSIRISLLFWTICLLPVNALADKPKGYKLFNQSDGLVFNYVNDMVRDRDGHVWLATERGLFLFDGANFLRITDPSLESEDAVLKLQLEGADLYVIYERSGCSRLQLQDFRVTRITGERIAAVAGPTPDRIYLLKADGKLEYFRSGKRIAQTVLPHWNQEGGLNCFHGRLVASLYGGPTYLIDTADLQLIGDPLPIGVNARKQNIFETADTLFITRDDTVYTISQDFQIGRISTIIRQNPPLSLRCFQRHDGFDVVIGNSNTLYRNNGQEAG